MNILVLQHLAVEHPGIFRDFMSEDGISWHTVELDAGDTIPELIRYDALLVMGGPMDVWEEDKHPWLVEEKAAIRRAVVDLKLPYLGICLGHQLLADALGGKVAPMPEPEVGILDIELTRAGQDSPLFAGLDNTLKSLQWHGAEVAEAPPGSQVLAQSPLCAIQALQVGETAFSMQCHVELTTSTVSDWGHIPEYEQALEKTLGPGSLAKLDADAARHMKQFNAAAQIMYLNFIQQLNRQP